MRLRVYISSQIECFKENAIVAFENMDEASIHDMRVAMKRLYALYDQKGIDKSLYKEDLKSLKKFFKLFGKIRDLQLLSAFSKSNLSYSDYKTLKVDIKGEVKNLANHLQTEYSSDFISNTAQVIRQNLIEQDVLQDDVIHGSLRSQYQKYHEEVKENIAQPNVNFHHIRRLIKKQQYLLEMMNVVAIEPVNPKLIKLKKLLGKGLGEWHDLKVISSYYSNKSFIPASVIESINRNAQMMLKQIMQKNKEALLKPLC